MAKYDRRGVKDPLCRKHYVMGHWFLKESGYIGFAQAERRN